MKALGRYVVGGLMRRRLRTLVTLSGVSLACAGLFSLASFQRGYQRGLREELDRLGAHVLVVPKGCPYDAASIALHGASWPCFLKEEYLETVASTPHVAAAAPVYMSAVFRRDTGAQVVYCGVRPDIAALKTSWRVNGRLPARGEDLLVGVEIARANHWSVGQSISLPGIEGARGRICGILGSTGGADDFYIYFPLTTAQRLFQRPGQLTHILVRLDDPANMDAVVAALRGCGAGLEMNVVPLAHLFRTIQNLVDSTRLILLSAAVVGLLVAGAGVSNAILMAVVERTREIGVLRAVGASPVQVFGIFWSEAMALCLMGSLVGIAGSFAGSRSVESWLRARLPFTPSGALIQPDVAVAFLCVAGAMAVGSLAAFLPAMRAAHLSPVAAIRAQRGGM